jgi:hypothetical protein
MKTLILTDERYEQLLHVLGQTRGGRDILAAVPEPALPADRDLIAADRGGDGPPDLIAQLVSLRHESWDLNASTRERIEALLLHCYAAGVRPVTLGRWFGLRPSRVYEILGGKP